MSGTLLTHRTGANNDVLVLTLYNPGFRNALHPDMYAAGVEVLSTASHNPDVRAIVLRGADNFFCAGGNLNRLLGNRQLDPSVQRESIELLGSWVEALVACPKPVIASVEGAAAGAGLALVLACDMVVAADNTKFTAAYIKTALSPDGGGSWFASRLLPKNIAFELLMLGDTISAARLHQLGVVNVVTAAGQADAAAIALGERFAAGPQDTLGRIKRLLAAAPVNDLSQHLIAERDAFVDSLFSADCGEGIDAFLNKRAAKFA
jgi:enoyl-CoA hydratase/carnithine racemase